MAGIWQETIFWNATKIHAVLRHRSAHTWTMLDKVSVFDWPSDAVHMC